MAICSAAWADAPATQFSPEDIDRLIRQLSADDFRARQSAQDQLVNIGERARAGLQRAAKEASDEETRSRAESALVQIDENAIAGPSQITLHLKDVAPAELFKQLSDQCGVALEPAKSDLWDKKPFAPVSIDVDRQPFWNAMLEAADKTGIELRMEGNDPKLAAGRWADTDGLRYISGPFLIVANRIEKSRVIELGAAHRSQGDFAIRFTCLAEPKVRLLGAAPVAKLEEAVDENGNSLIPPAKPGPDRSGGAFTEAPTGRWTCTARLQQPDPGPNVLGGTKISRLRGHIDVLFQSKFETLEFDQPANAHGVSKRAAGLEIVLQELRARSDKYELTLSIQFDRNAPGAPANGPIDRDRIRQSIASDLRLLDAKGNSFPFASCGISATREDRIEVVVKLRIPPADPTGARQMGEPVRVVWNMPSAVKQLSVPFEFADVPIP
jgi:hypothetical protein